MAKRVILYSGGLDSFVMRALYYRPGDELIHFQTGTDDNVEEMNRISHMQEINFVHLSISPWELDNKIVPFRNCMFVLAAAQYGSEIYLGATKGDTTKDKDYVFKAIMESMLNYFALDENKRAIPDYPYTVHLPFKTMTKREIVEAYFVKVGRSIDTVKAIRDNTYSCYTPIQGEECQECRACLRKYVALRLNGVTLYKPSPRIMQDFLAESREKGRQQEIEEIVEVIRLDQEAMGG